MATGQWHVGPNGPGRCNAREGNCPFSSEERNPEFFAMPHYAKAEEAIKAYEAAMAAQNLPTTHRRSEKPTAGVPPTEPLWIDNPNNTGLNAMRAAETELLASARATGRELTGMEIKRHGRYVGIITDRLVAEKKTTNHLYTTAAEDGSLEYLPWRARQQEQLIEDFLAAYGEVPAEGEVIFAGGLGGAGKSTVLSNHAGVDRSRYVTINPDDLKEMMAERGMIPEVPGMTPMEASTLVHAEAGYLTDRIVERLRKEKRNLIFDGTMGWKPYIEEQAIACREAGYGKVEAIFVDITPETSHERAVTRHELGLQGYLTGKNSIGGRYLPEQLIYQQRSDDSAYNSKNAQNLQSLAEAGIFTATPRIFDNNVSGRSPRELTWAGFLRRSSSSARAS